jgi:hypothetical protein
MQKEKKIDGTMPQFDTIEDDAIRFFLRKTAGDVPPVEDAVLLRIREKTGNASDFAGHQESVSNSIIQNFIDRIHFLLTRPYLAWGVVAVQAVVLCILIISSPQQAIYQILSSDQLTGQYPVPALYVMFDDEATIGDIEKLLAGTGGIIINGPGKKLVYTIQFQRETTESINKIINLLQGNPLITFVEYIN